MLEIEDCQVTWRQEDDVFARNKVWNFVLSDVFPIFINSIQVMQTQQHTARGEKKGGKSSPNKKKIQPWTQLGSRCPKVMSFFALHTLSQYFVLSGEKRARLCSAFVFKWLCDLKFKPINSLISSRRKINRTVSFPARPLAAFTGMAAENFTHLGTSRASTKWKCSLISFIYPLPPPEPFCRLLHLMCWISLEEELLVELTAQSLEADCWLHWG